MKRDIKLAKMQYKDKVQDELRMGNSRSAWRGIKSMMGIQDKKETVSNTDKSGYTLAEELNQFYLRFDSTDFYDELSKFREAPVSSRIQIDEISVWSTFEKINARKCHGPDGISGRLIKCCAPFLSEVFTYIFQWSLSLNKVPTLWKESIIVPVAKVPSPKNLNDYGPVALTSVVMKSFEHLVKKNLFFMTQTVMDPLQFAYQPRKGVEDAVVTLLNSVVRHLEGKKTHVRLCFADFSSAFNCMQPHVLAQRLSDIPSVDFGTICWIVDFLTTRPQRTRVNDSLSETLLCSTGSPQGCVLSPLLFMLYTNDCKSMFESRLILKFADDSVIVSLLQDHEVGHGPVLDYFIRWCDDSYLQLNVTKTKDMIIDFRKKQPVTAQTLVKGTAVETVSQYKYLGTILDDKLSFKSNSDAICRKVNQRLFYLRKLRSFNVDKKLLKMFYSSFIESILTFAVICFFGNVSISNKNKLRNVIKLCQKTIGTSLNDLDTVYQVRATQRAKAILANPLHPLHAEFRLLPSKRRYTFPRQAKSNRYLRSFVPSAIGFLNKL